MQLIEVIRQTPLTRQYPSDRRRAILIVEAPSAFTADPGALISYKNEIPSILRTQMQLFAEFRVMIWLLKGNKRDTVR